MGKREGLKGKECTEMYCKELCGVRLFLGISAPGKWREGAAREDVVGEERVRGEGGGRGDE